MFFVVLLFVIMTIWMAVAVVKHGKDHTADYDHGDGKKQVVFALAMSSTIFLVVDGNLFVNSTWDTHVAFWNFEKAEKDPKRIRVQINARQWAWDVRYAGPDGTFNTEDDIVTLNDLRIPVDAPVIIHIASSDVIHSIYLPHLRQKIDAVPGTVNRLWFQAKKTGRYEMACAQHCGMAHYKMSGVVTVLPQDEYATWAARASANSVRAFDPKDKAAHWGWPWREDR
jgi:cytochrome c oxidase subunit 2